MTDYQKIYNEKKGTVAEALAIISDGDYLAPGYCANEPFTILGQLHTLQDREDIHKIRILYSLANGDYPFFEDAYKDTFHWIPISLVQRTAGCIKMGDAAISLLICMKRQKEKIPMTDRTYISVPRLRWISMDI